MTSFSGDDEGALRSKGFSNAFFGFPFFTQKKIILAKNAKFITALKTVQRRKKSILAKNANFIAALKTVQRRSDHQHSILPPPRVVLWRQVGVLLSGVRTSTSALLKDMPAHCMQGVFPCK